MGGRKPERHAEYALAMQLMPYWLHEAAGLSD